MNYGQESCRAIIAVDRAAASLSLATVNDVLRWHPCSGGWSGGGGCEVNKCDGMDERGGQSSPSPTSHPAAGGTLTSLPVVVAVMVLGLPGGGHV